MSDQARAGADERQDSPRAAAGGDGGFIALVLAAGQGKRMRSARPKALFDLCGASMLEHVLDSVVRAGLTRAVVVVGHGREEVEAELTRITARLPAPLEITTAVQQTQAGTGDAVMAAREALLASGSPRVLILPADVPLVRAETLSELIAGHAAAEPARVLTVLAADVDDPTGYGRVVRDPSGAATAIVEHRDATPEQLALHEINTGIYAGELSPVLEAVAAVGPENAQGEYYLTDIVALLAKQGRPVGVHSLLDASEVEGANDRAGLAMLTALLQERIQGDMLEAGVTIVDPASTYIEFGVSMGTDTVVHPFSVVRRGVTVGRNCQVGPFTHLRAGACLADGAEVGNFVEVKNSRLGEHAKAKHLTYLGDADVGDHANIGAGTITANYDGRAKHRTEIGASAFIGSGTVLVAPVKVGAGGITGAGAVVTRGRDVAPGETVIGVPARPLGRATNPTRSGTTPQGEQA